MLSLLPVKFTSLEVEVLPISLESSVLLTPSTRTFTSLPKYSLLSSSHISLTSATNLSNLSCLTFSVICSSYSYAGVPFLFEYRKVNAESYLTSLINSNVSLKSSSVSPGNPTIISVRSEEHTSELQSRQYLVCRLLLEKTKRPS